MKLVSAKVSNMFFLVKSPGINMKCLCSTQNESTILVLWFNIINAFELQLDSGDECDSVSRRTTTAAIPGRVSQ